MIPKAPPALLAVSKSQPQVGAVSNRIQEEVADDYKRDRECAFPVSLAMK
jgi:hypothetical protein